jgi:ribosomal-protein-alanine N-acetyltransferase
VRIRPIEPADAEALHSCAADERVAATCGIPHPYPRGAAEAWIAKAIERKRNGTEETFAILHDDAVAGVVMLRDINHGLQTAALEYFVASPLWNHGIATAAATQALARAFGKLTVVHASTLALNPASARVLEKLGFRKIGSHIQVEDPTDKFSGQAWDDWELKREDWDF